jgi:hypothetical protein
LNFQNELNVVWQESRQGESFDKLYMQSHTNSGAKLWNPTGVALCKQFGRQSSPQIVPSVAGDFWVLWLDERARHLGVQLMAQRFNMSGQSQLLEEGFKLGESMDEWNPFCAVSNGAGDLFIAWTQNIGNEMKSVFVQKLDPAGNKSLDYEGKQMGEMTAMQSSPNLAPLASGGAFLCYIEGPAQSKVYSIKGAIIR